MKSLNSDEFPSPIPPSSAWPLNPRYVCIYTQIYLPLVTRYSGRSADGRTTKESRSIHTPEMRNSRSGRISASTRVAPSTHQYIDSNEEISANYITEEEIAHRDTQANRVRSNFIYTPGVGSPSVKCILAFLPRLELSDRLFVPKNLILRKRDPC